MAKPGFPSDADPLISHENSLNYPADEPGSVVVDAAKSVSTGPPPTLKFNIWNLLAAVVLTLSWIVNAVTFKKVLFAMSNYVLFQAQLKLFFLVLGSAAMHFWEIKWGEPLTVKNVDFPKWKFIVVGFIDTFEQLLQTIGAVFVAGGLQVLLLQAVVPLSLVGSILIMGKRYHLVQVAAAALIMLGVVAALEPSLWGFAKSQLYWNLLFLSCTFFSVAANLYKESCFNQGATLGSMALYYNAALYVFCWIFGVATLYMSGRDVGVWGLPENMWTGWECMRTGVNIYPGDRCAQAQWLMPFHVFTNLLLNIMMLVVLSRKDMGTFVMYLASTFRVPVVNIAFTMTFIMGADASAPGSWNYIGLAVIVTGLLMFRFGPWVWHQLMEHFRTVHRMNAFS